MIGAVVVSPAFAEDRTVFVGATHGIYCSRDAGAGWEFVRLVDPKFGPEIRVSSGYPAAEAPAWKEHIAAQREKAFAIKLAVSPAFGEDGTVFAGTAYGLRRSRDGGRTWQRLAGDGFDEQAYIEAIAVSPSYGTDATLAVSVRGRGHFRSDDGGESFVEIGSDLTGDNVLLAQYVGMIPKFPSLVFSPEYATDQTLFGFSGTEIFRSVDAGISWDTMPAPIVATSTRIFAGVRHGFAYYRVASRTKRVAPILLVLLFLGAGFARLTRSMRRGTDR
jgi:hypothetical protein